MKLTKRFIRLHKPENGGLFGGYQDFRKSEFWDSSYLNSIIFDENTGIIWQNEKAYGSDVTELQEVIDLVSSGGDFFSTLETGGIKVTEKTGDLSSYDLDLILKEGTSFDFTSDDAALSDSFTISWNSSTKSIEFTDPKSSKKASIPASSIIGGNKILDSGHYNPTTKKLSLVLEGPGEEKDRTYDISLEDIFYNASELSSSTVEYLEITPNTSTGKTVFKIKVGNLLEDDTSGLITTTALYSYLSQVLQKSTLKKGTDTPYVKQTQTADGSINLQTVTGTLTDTMTSGDQDGLLVGSDSSKIGQYIQSTLTGINSTKSDENVTVKQENSILKSVTVTYSNYEKDSSEFTTDGILKGSDMNKVMNSFWGEF